MNNILKKSYIGDICDINLSTYSLSENWKFVNYLDTGNITKNKIENVQYIDLSVDKLPSRARRKVEQNNIIYSTVRPNQMHYGIIKRKLLENFLVSTGFAVLDVDSTQAEPYFVYYSLIQDDNTTALQAIAEQSTSAYPSIKPSDIKNREILLPPLETQQKIAKVLSVIDDKIELNNSINNNLEQQAQAIFKSWFVDFEPFGGTMPDDWKVVDLGDICNISAGGDKPSKFSVIQTQEFQIPIYSNGINNEGLYGYTNYAKINNESVTISARGTIGYTCLRLNPFFPIVRLICIEPKNRLFSAKYLYQAIKRMDIVGFGTTQQQITVPYCKTLKILLPSKEYLYKYANIVDRLYKEIFENKNENIKLIQLRDTLLPKLMSGEIDVSKVDISADKLLFSEDINND